MSESKKIQKKLKEITEVIEKFNEAVPLSEPSKLTKPVSDNPDQQFTVVESSHTLTYAQKEWSGYVELVRHS